MNVRDIVTTTLTNEGNGAYTRYAEGVIDAVQTRIDEATASLLSAAESRGLPASEARNILVEAGLITPEPEVASINDDLAATLDRISTVLDRLTRFAAQHGYRG